MTIRSDNEKRKLDLRNLIAEEFPNISAIDVTQLLDEISVTIIKMSLTHLISEISLKITNAPAKTLVFLVSKIQENNTRRRVMGETIAPIRPSFNHSVQIEGPAEKLTAETGALLLREADERIGLIDCLAGGIIPFT